MQVRVRIMGISKLSHKFSKAVEVEAHGGTLNDLLQTLVIQYGTLIKEELLDKNGKLKENIQVLANNRFGIYRENREAYELCQDDEITFMRFIGGG